MKPWYEQNPKLFQREKDALAASYPTLEIAVRPEGYKINAQVELKNVAVVAHGIFPLRTEEGDSHFEYGISLYYLSNYPRTYPILYCADPKLPDCFIDRHILAKGQACLGVPTDIRRRWQASPNIVTFLDTIVAPFLAWQVHYDAFGTAPPWGERAHFGKGVEQYYAEVLGLSECENIIGFMRLLARKNSPQGHETCPCGSGNNLRNCHHRELISHARTIVNPFDAAEDIKRLESEGKMLKILNTTVP
jgi:hypothetical protein